MSDGMTEAAAMSAVEDTRAPAPEAAAWEEHVRAELAFAPHADTLPIPREWLERILVDVEGLRAVSRLVEGDGGPR
jgi:hypothetical protein